MHTPLIPGAAFPRAILSRLGHAGALALFLMSAGCGRSVNPSVVPLPPSALPSQESWRSTVTFTDSARVKAVLWAGHIAEFQSERVTLLDDSVHVDFFDEEGRHTSLLTARRGKVNDATQDFEADDSVVVVSDSGSTMKTDRLFWTNADRTIHTDAYVDITSPTEHITGKGMVSDQDLRNYRIFRVTGEAVKGE
ncbi:MAG TPA: LPS export ABC transporter periplasmic protein LptC [Bacteroidota bacterium]|nr:LPS export ABC transporter periplasmic protein LptC [Bacteroidota bacterium]